MDRLLEDYESNPKLGSTARKDKKFQRVWEKVLEKFDKKNYQIQTQKQFKTLTRSISLVPNFTSEYKASQIYAMHENYLVQNKGRPVGQAMNKHDVLRSIFLLFSVSTSVHDIELYAGQAGVG